MIGIPIFIGFIMLIALLLTVGVRRGGRWYTNVGATVLTLSFCFVVWGSLNSYRGWPIRTGLPTNAIFVGGIVDEPSSVNSDPGHIDLWLVPVGNQHQLLGYTPSQGEPRAYREPFSVPLEDAVQHAQSLQHGGQPVAFSAQPAHGRSGGRGKVGRKISQRLFRAYRLPLSSQSLKGGR